MDYLKQEWFLFRVPKLYNLTQEEFEWPQYTTNQSAPVAIARFSLDPDTQVVDLRSEWQPRADFWLAIDNLLQFPPEPYFITNVTQEQKLESGILKLDREEVCQYLLHVLHVVHVVNIDIYYM